VDCQCRQCSQSWVRRGPFRYRREGLVFEHQAFPKVLNCGPPVVANASHQRHKEHEEGGNQEREEVDDSLHLTFLRSDAAATAARDASHTAPEYWSSIAASLARNCGEGSSAPRNPASFQSPAASVLIVP